MTLSGFYYSALREYLNTFLKRIPFIYKLNLKARERSGNIIPFSRLASHLGSAEEIKANVPGDITVGLVKDDICDSPEYFTRRASWPKFERFLLVNKIKYSFYDIHKSTWQEEANAYDIIIWQPRSTPDLLPEAKSKIYFLEKYLRKRCFPSFDQLWSYEDKIHASFLYNYFRLPVIPTFSTYSKSDALEYADRTEFPVISKITTGSASCGVDKLKNKKSLVRYINSIFSGIGRKTYWPFIRQINYVYFQQFISTAKFDLRIIVVGTRFFGYYRFPNKGDFRASGSGNVLKKELPEDAMRLALKTKETLNAISMAVDMLFSEAEQKYYIIETSIFCGIDTAEQLVVDGIAGYYEYQDDKFTFREGRFWIQELALKEFFNSLDG